MLRVYSYYMQCHALVSRASLPTQRAGLTRETSHACGVTKTSYSDNKHIKHYSYIATCKLLQSCTALFKIYVV